MNRSRATTLLPMLALVLGAACAPTPPPPPAQPFPAELVRQLLDAPPDRAMATIAARYPEVSMTDGPLRRAFIDGDPWIEEIVLFTNIRSGRVDTVILKYPAALPEPDKRKVLEATGLDGLADEARGQEVVERPWRGLTLRTRWADKQGRMSVTVASGD